MQNDPLLTTYIEARRRFYERLEQTKRAMDTLLAQMLERPSTMEDLAMLEGLHAEKHRLIVDFISTEERFVEQLLAKRKLARSDGAASGAVS